MRPSVETHYHVLGVKPDATPDEIRKAYRRLSLMFHPDRSQGDVEKYQTINEAYEVLSDASKRMSYDVQLRFSRANGGSGDRDILSEILGGLGAQPTSLNADDLSVLLRAFTHSNPNRTGMGEAATDGGGSGSGDVLSGLMGVLNRVVECAGVSAHARAPGGDGGIGGGAAVRSATSAPPDIRMKLEIELEQAYAGCSLPLRVTRTVVSRDEYAPVSSFTDNQRTECVTVYIEVPRGVDEGEMIRVAGAGHCRHGVCGDVCVTVALKPHEVYQRDGLNLIYTHNISLTDSLCGFSFDIEHFGKTYTICNDVGNVIPSNHRKVIPEKGMHREGHSGNLIVHFKVMYPKTIPLETCEWLRTNLEACPN